MRSLQILLTLFGAIGLLMLGATAVAAGPVPPCHETSGMTDHAPPQDPAGRHSKSPQHSTAPKGLAAMSCCIACVAGQPYRPMLAAAPAIATARAAAAPSTALIGRSPAPEPGPPRD